MPLFWLRVAVVFYGLGLLYALLALTRRHEILNRIIMPVVGIGFVLHFVSLTEHYVAFGRMEPVSSVHNSESLLAFLLMIFFTGVYIRYRTTSIGIFVFPLVFLLTFSAAVGQQPPQFASALLRSGWIVVHVALIFTGYAALFFSFAASLLYLVQERSLKSKGSALFSHLPALETIDQMGYRSLLLGFPFMTFGLIAGSVIAQSRFGPVYFLDPKIVLSLLMYFVYMVLVYTRWSAGWRGRRAAYLSTFAFLAAILAWAANYVSGVHRFIAP